MGINKQKEGGTNSVDSRIISYTICYTLCNGLGLAGPRSSGAVILMNFPNLVDNKNIIKPNPLYPCMIWQMLYRSHTINHAL